MSTDDLLKELRGTVNDDTRRLLIDAYLKKPDAQSIAAEALNLLSTASDENQTA